MNKITAFQCEYCGKVLKSRSGMKNHESRCFKNPASKSCITCQFLTSRWQISGRLLTDIEQEIIEFRVPGTFHIQKGIMECDHAELNPEYEHLHDAEFSNYCLYFKCLLPKLNTICPYHETYSAQKD